MVKGRKSRGKGTRVRVMSGRQIKEIVGALRLAKMVLNKSKAIDGWWPWEKDPAKRKALVKKKLWEPLDRLMGVLLAAQVSLRKKENSIDEDL